VAAIVVPFRGADAKLRLAPLDREARSEIALATLGDVLSACRPVGETRLVTGDEGGRGLAHEVGDVELVDDPGDGQGAAVAAALAGLDPGPVLVLNADVPCVLPHDIRSLLRSTPAGGLALVEAGDGTTNALGLPAPEVFAPLYGPGSAGRFKAHAQELGLQPVSVQIPNICDDVDTVDDLRRVGLRAGPRTQATIATLGLAA
jgi:2-phospho-L-lactate guanylyltransferase